MQRLAVDILELDEGQYSGGPGNRGAALPELCARSAGGVGHQLVRVPGSWSTGLEAQQIVERRRPFEVLHGRFEASAGRTRLAQLHHESVGILREQDATPADGRGHIS